MLKNIKIYTSDPFWRKILTQFGANITDSQNAADVNFDNIKIRTPISLDGLMNVLIRQSENADIIKSVFGRDVVLPILQRKIIIALDQNPDISMRKLKDIIGISPNITTHSVENAVYQLRKKYGGAIIENNDGKYRIGHI